MIENFTPESFEPLIGEKFTFSLEGAVLCDMELIELTRHGERAPSKGAFPLRTAPFSILFKGPAEPILEQRIFDVAQEKLGVFDLFIVPLGPEEDGMIYESVFN